jgi:PPK2 family polyphosphate:nucleotide phosphotransferase
MNLKQFIFNPDAKGSLEIHDPNFTENFRNEEEAKDSMQADCSDLAKYQDILLAHESHGLLLIFQGMDGAGKDAAIKHVMSSADPQGCSVRMFKVPSKEERKHDYLWTAAKAIPARGQIGIFNRSYYEHVIADRVHREKLDEQKLPADAKGKDIWKKRYRHINNFEQYLADEGIVILKFFINISKETQREKLLERINRADKKWKFSMDDVEDREHWEEYQKISAEVFKQTGTKTAPWHIIPANNRWFARATVAAIIVDKLKSLHAKYPAPSEEQKEELAKAEKTLKK